MNQYVYFSGKSLDVCVQITRNYFTDNVGKCTFQEDNYNEINQTHSIIVFHEASGNGIFSHVSYGENYQFIFEKYYEETYKTKITVYISTVGKFLTAMKVPDEILGKWAILIGSKSLQVYQAPKGLIKIILISIIPIVILLIALILIFNFMEC